MLQKSEWYRVLPDIIFDEYRVIQNSRGNDGICYFWNQRNVENTCSKEWERIREVGKSIYGLNPDNLSILWDANQVSYVYIDDYNNTYLLDYDGNARVDHLFEVQDAMASGVGDPFFLNTYLKNMNAYYEASQYRK